MALEVALWQTIQTFAFAENHFTLKGLVRDCTRIDMNINGKIQERQRSANGIIISDLFVAQTSIAQSSIPFILISISVPLNGRRLYSCNFLSNNALSGGIPLDKLN